MYYVYFIVVILVILYLHENSKTSTGYLTFGLTTDVNVEVDYNHFYFHDTSVNCLVLLTAIVLFSSTDSISSDFCSGSCRTHLLSKLFIFIISIGSTAVVLMLFKT